MSHLRFHTSECAPGLFLVEGPASNWVIAREGRRFTLVDAGYPGDLPLLLESITGLGLDPADAAALLITHAHTDHTGAAAHLANNYGTPVYSAAAERPSLLGSEKHQVGFAQVLPKMWRPRVFRWSLHAIRAGGLQENDIAQAAVADDGTLAALPGSPVPVDTPGHTPGHRAYYFPQARVLASGDALIGGHMISTVAGPQMLHPMFHHDVPGAHAALQRFAGLEVDVVLPGHGPAFAGPLEGIIARLGG
ncbi:glyoxylase-like metal-dependent hydrolase (beta-lactamase superfamily II) [Arthrobacter stackebrandtii]|uniref:Glyoxylase-like metal-dependent hydrolase (Beta-lactamase superfamily II) n=1 Tax=Arthrobacter stackebrandtii TaxID=272161 RepID=A0ABS4YT53_9MICC|nr:MBL fold metallo-hydrolase [Arthrobacter stackebrandtii]MBP2411983.1 glyoxylase-like metal-dependent hydrolase (beta-lactamase superfamily II) [Arthrobacter stackebrandtii]PYG99763.1 MBL fold metallo-hydrolase [Arthrobacter stackebrandtii]